MAGLVSPAELHNATTLATGDEFAMNREGCRGLFRDFFNEKAAQFPRTLYRRSSENTPSRTFVDKGKNKGRVCERSGP
jgi:hypothetical protein